MDCPICADPALVALVADRRRSRTPYWRVARELQDRGVEPFVYQQEPGVARRISEHFRWHAT